MLGGGIQHFCFHCIYAFVGCFQLISYASVHFQSPGKQRSDCRDVLGLRGSPWPFVCLGARSAPGVKADNVWFGLTFLPPRAVCLCPGRNFSALKPKFRLELTDK